MNEAEKKAFERLSKKEQEEVIGGSDLTAAQCATLRSKVEDIPGRHLVKYGGPPPKIPDIEKLLQEKGRNPAIEYGGPMPDLQKIIKTKLDNSDE